MTTTNVRVYVSGPYTKGDQVINVRNAIQATDLLFGNGYFPYCPHLTHFWHMLTPRPWQDWMNLDLEWVKTCHCLLRLPGESTGADMEVAKAVELGIPVYHSFEELKEKCPISK